MPVYVDGNPRISEGDVELFAIDYTAWLDGDEVLTGTPTVTEVTTTDLTLSSKQVNTAAITVQDEIVAIGKAVQFKVADQTASTADYIIEVTVSTDSGRTILRRLKFNVV